MTVFGFYFTAVNANVNEDHLFGSINVTSTPSIQSVEKKDVTNMKEIVGIKFRYTTAYEKAGEIILEGEVLYKVENAKDTEKLWKDSQRMEDDMAVDVLNFILRRCVTKTLDISESLRLPPPIQFPTVTKENPQGKQKKKE
jgi:hypothetical protein